MYKFHDEQGNLLDKHLRFFKKAMSVLSGHSPYRKMFFGGGIRGGKTYLCLYIIIVACRLFKGMRAHIIRKSYPSLISTVVPSIKKLLVGVDHEEKKQSGNYYFRFPNGSEIYLFSESFDIDKDLDRFKGLETNIILLEQIEELQEKTYQKAIERVGTYIMPSGTPPPLILSTMNPTQVMWVRKLIYEPFRDGNIPEDTYIQMITAAENPFIPEYLHENWKSMSDIAYKQYVLGDWDCISNESSFFHQFNKATHVKKCKLESNIVISFDFNVNPMTAIIANIDENANKVYVCKEFRQENSSVRDLVRSIVPYVKNKIIRITGDGTGNSRNVATGKSLYLTIQNEFSQFGINIPNTAFIAGQNEKHVLSRQLCNDALKVMDIQIDPSCEFLIEDLFRVMADEKGNIIKKDQSLTHLSDCFRYIIHNFFKKKLIIQ